jgi:hypothetical protein
VAFVRLFKDRVAGARHLEREYDDGLGCSALQVDEVGGASLVDKLFGQPRLDVQVPGDILQLVNKVSRVTAAPGAIVLDIVLLDEIGQALLAEGDSLL